MGSGIVLAFIIGILWGIGIGAACTKKDRCECCEYNRRKNQEKTPQGHGCCGIH
ncbi:Uncharacterised protein [uncultured archaeon]|nr:Uncharacterised protein [uncultured archaeon]